MAVSIPSHLATVDTAAVVDEDSAASRRIVRRAPGGRGASVMASSTTPAPRGDAPLGPIARSTGILAMATGASRVLGFVRDVLLAALFGTLPAAQAFVVAFRLPNALRDLVAEGAVTSGFVPVLSWYRTTGPPEDFWRLGQVLLTRVVVLVGLLGLLGVLAAPLFVRVMAPGFLEDPEQFALTVRLTRVLFPLILLVAVWAYFMGLLNTLRHFAVPALGPAILNVSMIVALIWCLTHREAGVMVLAVAVLVGGLLQVLVQLPVAIRRGFRVRLRWRHPGSGQILRLLGPRVLGSAVYQANVLIHTALASLSGVVGVGAVAILYYANRLVQLPLALFGTASAQASLPSLAEQAARRDLDGFRATLRAVIRMVALVLLPATVGLIVLAVPIVEVLFERGAFDHRATVLTAQALACYAVGLLAYALSKVVSGAFYALQDTRTPVRLAVEAVAANVALSLLLMWPMQLTGLALAAALANILNAYRLLRAMERRLEAPVLLEAVGPLGRMLLASGVMGLGCWLLWRVGVPALPPVGSLAVVIAAGLGLYAGACLLLGVREFSSLLQWFGHRPILERFAGE